MALSPAPRSQLEKVLCGYSPSVGASPQTAALIAGRRSLISEIGMVLQGAPTSTVTITAFTSDGVSSVTSVAVTGGSFTVSSVGAGAGVAGSCFPTGSNYVNASDVITLVPSTGAGAAIGASFYVVLRSN
jgi:hypothetical protein